MIDVILKRFENPDEVRQFQKGRLELVSLGGLTIGRATYEPGWKWSLHVGPTTGAARCTVEHVGLVLAGHATAAFADGRVYDLIPGTLFHIPPEPHDSWGRRRHPLRLAAFSRREPVRQVVQFVAALPGLWASGGSSSSPAVSLTRRAGRDAGYVIIRHMRRTTLFMDEALEGDLQALARRRKRPVASLVREAIARYVTDEKRQAELTLGFLGVGRSGRGDVAERHEELLWRDLEPHGRAAAAGKTGPRRSAGARARGRSSKKR